MDEMKKNIIESIKLKMTETAEEICELEDRNFEIIHAEEKKKNGKDGADVINGITSKEIISKLLNSRRKLGVGGGQKVYLMNIPKMRRELVIQVPEANGSPNKQLRDSFQDTHLITNPSKN